MKEQLRDSRSIKKVGHIRFSRFSADDVRRLSSLPVVTHELYMPQSRNPHPYGPLDHRLGTSEKNCSCDTCGKKMEDCEGHFGHVSLELPVFHIGYFKAIYTILQKICKNCGRILMTDEDIADLSKKIAQHEAPADLHKYVVEKAKRMAICIRCNSFNGSIKKPSPFKLVHEKYAGKFPDMATYRNTFNKVTEEISNMPALLDAGRAQDDMTPLRVFNLFRLIPDSDCPLLDLNLQAGRPETLLIKELLVPPACIRPTVPMESGSNEDDLTMMLVDVLKINNELRHSFEVGEHMSKIFELWEQLQLSLVLYINSETRLPPGSQPAKRTRGFCQRLKGKQGRFRGNLSGKRVNFSGRTVISPDPNLRIDQVGVPQHIAKILTYPEKVNDHNIAKLRQLVTNGPDVYPGANYIESGKVKRFLKYGNRKQIARDLRPGDTIERHLIDGDIVLFNRQPSLHRLSIMCHQVKVLPWRTLRFNECVCTPYNADFDGDEMNIHVPQTETARAEALVLMGTKANICTPRNGDPLIAATQDFLTGAYVLSLRDTFLSRARFCQLATYLSTGVEKIVIPPPCILKPIQLWSGKQLLSLLLRPVARPGVKLSPINSLINLETGSKSYSKTPPKGDPQQYGNPVLSMCPDDGYVLIRNSELLSGVLDKGVLGSGSKSTIFYVLLRDCGEQAAADAMSRLAKVASFFLQNRGFSIGIGDVEPSEALTRAKQHFVSDGYAACKNLVRQHRTGRLETQSGCDADQTLENKMTQILNQIREQSGKECNTTLRRSNTPLIMAKCGSKGSPLNLSQMIACVGQQTVNGSRMPNGFDDRALPHFARLSKLPEAKGFVSNSFYTGLKPTEFFFHTMGGREGLVDSAVKTAETGYMQRRLMKALEDLSTHYDRSVRTSIGAIVQFHYGDDGLDPLEMEADDSRPLKFDRTLLHVCNTEPRHDQPALLPYQIMEVLHQCVESPSFAFFKRGLEEAKDHFFVKEMSAFIAKEADKLAVLRERCGLHPGKKADEMQSEMPDIEHYVTQVSRLTAGQVESFCVRCSDKYQRSCVEAGTAVGAICGQSLGEPTTQMTLKTFHFSGIASMNITLGVPRIKEIINAVKNTTTPIITATLDPGSSNLKALSVRGRIQRAVLSEIITHIDLAVSNSECELLVRLDMDRIRRLCLEIDVESVATAIVERSGKWKLRRQHVRVLSVSTIAVSPPVTQGKHVLYQLHQLRADLPNIVVKGLDRIRRAVLQKDASTYKLLVEGDNLLHVMGTPGVVGTSARSNHILDVERTLGIEAARSAIITEVTETVKPYGISIDWRHLSILADLMTTRGQVHGITRSGIAKMNERVLMLASFERTNDILFDASVHGKRDDIDGVSECIILGVPISLGTGLFKLVRRADDTSVPPSRSLLFDRPRSR